MTAKANAVQANKLHQSNNELEMHRSLSLLTAAAGFILLLRQIYAESEPGAIPLLLIGLGSAWYFAGRLVLSRQRSNHTPTEDPARPVP